MHTADGAVVGAVLTGSDVVGSDVIGATVGGGTLGASVEGGTVGAVVGICVGAMVGANVSPVAVGEIVVGELVSPAQLIAHTHLSASGCSAINRLTLDCGEW